MTFAELCDQHKEFFELMRTDEVFSRAVCIGVAFIFGGIDMIEGDAVRQKYEALVKQHEEIYGNGVMAIFNFYLTQTMEDSLQMRAVPGNIINLFSRNHP